MSTRFCDGKYGESGQHDFDYLCGGFLVYGRVFGFLLEIGLGGNVEGANKKEKMEDDEDFFLDLFPQIDSIYTR